MTAIVTSCVSGEVVSIADSNAYMDPLPLREVVYLKGEPVFALWERIQDVRRQLGEEALLLRTTDERRRYYNLQEMRPWHDRIHVRKVQVSDAQVEAARRRMPPP